MTASHEQEKIDYLDRYLTETIAQQASEPFFAEDFSFQDIYVPPKAQPVTMAGDVDEYAKPVDLESWVKLMLQDDSRCDHVLLIQGEPGRGKSVFCRMFAHWVWENWYPTWTPILIPLRETRPNSSSFRDTLPPELEWINDEHPTRLLFIIDGFDELPMESRTNDGLEGFLRQISDFQRECGQHPELGHRVIITGRGRSLHSIRHQIPRNLAKVELLPFTNDHLTQWLQRWGQQVGKAAAQSFQAFLNDPHCPAPILDLVREPLILYLLAALHRDGALSTDTDLALESLTRTQAKTQIYRQTLTWVTHSHRPNRLNQALTESDISALSAILPDRNIHEFLVAQRLQTHLERWADSTEQNWLSTEQMDWEIYDLLGYGQLTPEVVDHLMVAWPTLSLPALFQRLEHFYLRWCHGTFINVLSENLPQRKLWQLREQGQQPNPLPGLPQIDVYAGLNVLILLLELHRYTRSLAGRSPELTFYPCGHPDTDAFDEHRLLRLIGYSRCIGAKAFREIVGPFLRGADLSLVDLRGIDLRGGNFAGTVLIGVNFTGTDLSGADLRLADLSGTDFLGATLRNTDFSGADLSLSNLSRTNLIGANLRGTNLSTSDLVGADLRGANLSRANLLSADLSGANLSRVLFAGANLCDTNLSRTDLSHASLENIAWDEQTKWDGAQGLGLAVHVPDPLKKRF